MALSDYEDYAVGGSIVFIGNRFKSKLIDTDLSNACLTILIILLFFLNQKRSLVSF